MSSKRQTTRRDFLKGRAAVHAMEDMAEGVLPDPVSPLQAPRPTGSFLVQVTRRAMAANFQVFVSGKRHPHGPDAAMKALDLIERIEDQLTVYRKHSDIIRINRRAGREPVRVETRLFALLEHAQRLYRQTEGAFDITSGPLSKVWGFFWRKSQFPDPEALEQAFSRVGGKWIELDRPHQTIRFLKPDLEINLNAMGKGYALDRCSEQLAAAGVTDYLMHGGKSSVLARGNRAESAEAGEGWSVALRHPLRPKQRLAEIRLRDRALGTSGSMTQFLHHRGRRYGHVLDPRTGWPAEGILSATAIAPLAAEADALSTAFYVMGLEATREYCRRYPDVSALLTCPGPRRGSVQVHPIGLDESDWQLWETEPSG